MLIFLAKRFKLLKIFMKSKAKKYIKMFISHNKEYFGLFSTSDRRWGNKQPLILLTPSQALVFITILVQISIVVVKLEA